MEVCFSLVSATDILLNELKVVNPRVALLSNFEVLTLLRELESDHLTRTKLAQRIKKEDEASGTVHGSSTLANINAHLEATENLRTIEVEVRNSDDLE